MDHLQRLVEQSTDRQLEAAAFELSDARLSMLAAWAHAMPARLAAALAQQARRRAAESVGRATRRYPELGSGRPEGEPDA